VPFFEPVPPPRPRPGPPPLPDWAAPPSNILPAVLPLTRVVARNEGVVAALVGAAVYPSGVELRLTVRSQEPMNQRTIHSLLSPYEPGAGALQVGVLLADGSRASHPTRSRPHQGRLTPRAGGSESSTSWRDLWLWPLPPAGPVEVFLTWPAAGLAEQSTVLDGAQLQAAAVDAVELWPAQAEGTLTPQWYAWGGPGEPHARAPVPPALPPAGEQPADATAALAAVRTAFEQALTAADGGSIEHAVQDGAVLGAALEQARASFPEAVATAWAEVTEVVFLDPLRAAVRFAVHYTGGAEFGQQIGYAVLEGNRWKVAYDTCARVLGWAGVITPPTPPTWDDRRSHP